MPPILPVQLPQPQQFLGVQQTYVVDPSRQSIQPLPNDALTISIRYPSPNEPAIKSFLACIPDPATFLMEQHFKIRTLLERDGQRLPVRYRNITLSFKDGEGLADTQGDTITLSMPWISSCAAEKDTASATLEFQGVITHELVHVIQYDGQGTAAWWWIEGLADYVRWKLGLAPMHWGKRGEGGSYEDGYETSAHFLGWLAERKLSGRLVQDVNEKLVTEAWRADWFEKITGLSVTTLWNVYKAQHQ